MKDVDFLPDWYNESRRRQSSVRVQYTALGIIFLIMVVCNSLATRSISMASAEISLAEPVRIRAEYTSMEVEKRQQHLNQLHEQMSLAEKLDDHFPVASTLAELSGLLNDHLIMKRLQFTAQAFADPGRPQDTTIQKSKTRSTDSNSLLLTLHPLRFRVVIEARATDAQAIAQFLSDLEESAYFDHVHLRYSRNSGLAQADQKVMADADDNTAGGKLRYLTDCEISCYVAQTVEPVKP
ncbi:hypothetical protein ACFL6U_16725 [Planctomycetota bacterium]